MNWTKDQQKVIDTRRKNLLVSAAAGAGKTAVLVARILSLITDPKDPADIDELLIVTFTRAAAGEMKRRIGDRIAEVLEEDPDNEHLQRQMTLIHNAQITTIDGFCAYVVRSGAGHIDLDPGFRIAEEGEDELIRSDVLSEVLEEAYAEEDPEFRQKFRSFVETFVTGKSEKNMEELILRSYSAAVSNPYPEKWLEMCRAENQKESLGEISSAPWMTELWRNADDLIERALRLLKKSGEILAKPTAPHGKYAEDYAAYLSFFTEMDRAGDDYEKRFNLVSAFAKPSLSGARPAKGESRELKDLYMKNREETAKIADDLKEKCFPIAPGLASDFQTKSAAPVGMLIELTGRFMKAFAEEKRKKNIIDFSDLEHFALEILREDGKRTPAAKELAERFRTVMIDEYQDSNYLQEEILTAVSRIEDGEDNYFCVGDVKQSIYSFRQARPDLFMDKFRRYEKNDGGMRIDLHKNFRSRHEIIETVNGIFRQVMRREIGGVEYDSASALASDDVLGYASEGGLDKDVEVMTVFTDEEPAEGGSVLQDRRAAAQKELEARAIAERIAGLVGKEMIADETSGQMRPVACHDIVILLRTMEGWAEPFARVLAERGIPVFSTARTGYFTAPEVVTVLNMLSVIDNPKQDIPLASVLRSAIVGLSADEMARIRSLKLPDSEKQPSCFADSVRLYIRYGTAGQQDDGAGETSGQAQMSGAAECSAQTDPILVQKLASFSEMLEKYREEAVYTPLHELISRIVTETGFGDYISALPGGAQRSANVRMLIEKAISYESTSYIGLFNFIRYIRKMQKYDVDFGEASALGENEDTVRIVSIHKSKGLEYPIVFAAGFSKGFNTQDLSGDVLIHPEFGFASAYVDYENRIKYPTLKRLAVRQKLLEETIGEELRVLYVALTRAKLKLILCGILKNSDKIAEKQIEPEKDGHLPYGSILNASNVWDWILPAANNLLDENEKAGKKLYPLSIRMLNPSGLIGTEARNIGRREEILNCLKSWDPETVTDENAKRLIGERFTFVYPFEGRRGIPVKVSVSDLKKAEMNEPEEGTWEKYAEPDIIPLVPEFMKSTEEKATLTGSDRGTAYHRFLSRLVYSPEPETYHAGEAPGQQLTSSGCAETVPGRLTAADISAQIAFCAEKKWLTEEEAACINPEDMLRFCAGPLGQRMAAAQKNGTLRREQPFVMGVTADRIDPSWTSEESVLVQGIIDAFFEEDGGIILVDYKTDMTHSAAELIRRYKVQLDAYAEALTRATGKTVKEKYIWSFAMGKEIKL